MEFHREICRCAANPLVSTLWEGIARNVLIVVNLAEYYVPNLAETAYQHRVLVEDLRQMMNDGIDEDRLRARLGGYHLQDCGA